MDEIKLSVSGIFISIALFLLILVVAFSVKENKVIKDRFDNLVVNDSDANVYILKYKQFGAFEVNKLDKLKLINKGDTKMNILRVEVDGGVMGLSKPVDKDSQ